MDSKRLALLTGSLKRLKVSDKKIVNGVADINQLIPFKDKWAWQKYLDSSANHWMPQEVPMAKDISQWKDPNMFSDQERHIIKYTMGFFSTADTLVANHLMEVVFPHITSPEVRQYLLIQGKEEAVHAHSYQYMIESLSMDEAEIFNFYREVPEVGNKMIQLLENRERLFHRHLDTRRDDDLKEFILNLVSQYIVMEGIFFYCGFVLLLQLGRQNKLIQTAEQIQYILRDESMHLNMGIDIINTIRIENPHIWDQELVIAIRKQIIQGLDLELDYARVTIQDGVLGMNMTVMTRYLKYIANRRLEQLGLEPHYASTEAKNEFPWMSEIIDLQKEKNFFETRVTEYQVGQNLWDDEDENDDNSDNASDDPSKLSW